MLLALACGRACKPRLPFSHFSNSGFAQTFPTHTKSHQLAPLHKPHYDSPRVTLACPAHWAPHSSNGAGHIKTLVRRRSLTPGHVC